MSRPDKKHGKLRKAVRIILIVLAVIIMLPIIALFIGRSVNDFRLRLPDGVREKVYVKLGGYEQYISIRGENDINPVVIFLHGGPGSPSGFLSYTTLLEGDYTFIQWDQRGCGRTYYQSPDAPLSLNYLLGDLDDLVDYAVARFHQPVFLVGHSWGTVLGIEYALKNPDKIAGYIGIGQMTDAIESGRLQAEAAVSAARTAENEADAEQIEELYMTKNEFGDENFDYELFTELMQLEIHYLDPDAKDPTLTALFSPDFGWNDLRYQLLLMSDSKGHFTRQMPLMELLPAFVPPASLDVPSAFIGGQKDYVCSTVLAKKYAVELGSPFYEIDNLGHAPMFDDPKVFAETLKEALNNLK